MLLRVARALLAGSGNAFRSSRYDLPAERTPDAARTPRVLVSVLRYNTYDETLDTLDTLLAQDYPTLRLEVVDNASPDGRIAEIRARFPSVDVRVLARNLGYAGAHNTALARAQAEGFDHLVLSNADVHAPPDIVRRLVETAERYEDIGAVGAVEVSFDTRRSRAVGGVGFSLWTGRGYWIQQLPPQDAPLPVDYVQGSFLLVTGRALTRGLRFDAGLFMYYDETDLGLELRRLGLRAVVDPRAVIRHRHVPGHLNPRAAYYYQRNRLYLVKKHGRWWHVLVYVTFTSLLELPLKAVVRGAQGHGRFVWNSIRGQIDGLRGKMGPDG
jgi:GT2 family glycosyltransferase